MCIYYAPGFVGLQQVQRSVSEHWCCVHQCHICHLVVFSPSLYGATYSDAMFSIQLYLVSTYMVLSAATPCFKIVCLPPSFCSSFCFFYVYFFFRHFFCPSLYGATFSDAMFSIRLFLVRPYMVLRAATPCFNHLVPFYSLVIDISLSIC